MPRPNAASQAQLDRIWDDMPARGGARAGVRGLRRPTVMRELPVDQVRPNPDQPRQSIDRAALEELKDSIRAQGLLQPINVWQQSEDDYQIIAGERRWTAYRELAAEAPNAERNPDPSRYLAIPAMIGDLNALGTLSPQDAVYVRSTVENVQREDLNRKELIDAFSRLLEILKSAEAVAVWTGKSLRTVQSYLALRKVPATIVAFDRGDITLHEAEALARAKASPEQVSRASRALMEARGNSKAPASAKKRVDRALQGLAVVGPAPGPTGSRIVEANGESLKIDTVRPAALPLLAAAMRRAELPRDEWAKAIQEACQLTNVWPKRPSK